MLGSPAYRGFEAADKGGVGGQPVFSLFAGHQPILEAASHSRFNARGHVRVFRRFPPSTRRTRSCVRERPGGRRPWSLSNSRATNGRYQAVHLPPRPCDRSHVTIARESGYVPREVSGLASLPPPEAHVWRPVYAGDGRKDPHDPADHRSRSAPKKTARIRSFHNSLWAPLFLGSSEGMIVLTQRTGETCVCDAKESILLVLLHGVAAIVGAVALGAIWGDRQLCSREGLSRTAWGRKGMGTPALARAARLRTCGAGGSRLSRACLLFPGWASP